MGNLPFWEFMVRVVVLYLVVMISLRIMGKREIGKLSVFDFVVSVMIAELSTLPMEDTDVPLRRSLISVAALVLLQLLVAWISLKSHRFRHWVEGEPSVLIEHGKIKDKVMKKIRYSTHDLLMQLREKGVPNVADVEFAILETSGQLSVIPKAEKRPLTAEDIGIRVSPEIIQMPVVVDGTPVKKTLDILSRDEAWLSRELNRLGYPTVNEVMYAAIDAHGMLHIDRKDSGNSGPNGSS